MFFQQIFEEKLAQYAYLIGCQATGEAIVVDPMRDIDRYKEIAQKNNLRITAATETHIHADYLSGLREFAEEGVKVLVSDEGDADWKYEWVMGSDYEHQLLKDGDEFAIGNIKFIAKHTPGHTPEHLSFLVADGAATDEPMGILSGDFIFVGDVGRPDLLETAAGQEGVMVDSAKVMYQSIQKFKEMPGYWQVWPGHGAGSACGKALGTIPESTVGYEKRFNNSIKAAISEQEFVDYILDGQPEPPLYFARMKRDNKKGPEVLGEIPQPKNTTVEQIIGQVRISQSVILDTRNRYEFMDGHIEGSLLSPLNKAFNTVAGSYIKENEQIFLIIEEEKVGEAALDLIRIGLDNIAGYVTPDQLKEFGEKGGELFTTETIDFKKTEEYLNAGEAYLLDVRKQSEFEEGHIPGAFNIAHTRLLDRIDEVPKDKPVMVSCRTGARSAVASALLEREDFVVKYVDDLIEEWLEKNIEH
ncbi:MAG TPA: rhodanese-like domain-containing protein [Gracilimonas sp.]|uniref:rhodanese-like domain-containing protein n=1 Tax=Gracilimonas sp. TaxID=1974203 RepID=UPI002DB5292B|nr:rhodanese-like domain-containing protein [Gracilimonas sp.]